MTPDHLLVDNKATPVRKEALRNLPVVQRKLRVGRADDPLEREADRIAATVLRRLQSPEATEAPATADSTSRVQRAAVPGHGLEGGDASPEVARRVQRGAGGGAPLDEGVRGRMEQAFGADFSGVRVHHDADADQLSRSLNARAFTVGSDIYFASGQYAPGSRDGDHLLAHELTHTLQQGSTRVQRSAVPASEVSTDTSETVRRWDMNNIDLSRATKITPVPTGQAVFMVQDGAGDTIVVKAEDYPISLINLATLVHKSVHDVEVVDSVGLDAQQKQTFKAKITDPTVTSDPVWGALGRWPRWASWNKQGLSDEEHARQMHLEQIGPLPLQAQVFAKGNDAKAQLADKSFRTFVQSPKYMRQLGAAAAVDMFLGNADRISAKVTNLGNWMAESADRVRLIDNMDQNAMRSFEKDNLTEKELFPPDMRAWAKDPDGYYTKAIDRLLQEAADPGKGNDPDIIKWAHADNGFMRYCMIADFEFGFKQSVEKLVSVYGKNKKGKAGREAKRNIKALGGESELVDYWEVLKARARFMQNPKQAASLVKTVKKRQTSFDKKKAKSKKG